MKKLVTYPGIPLALAALFFTANYDTAPAPAATGLFVSGLGLVLIVIVLVTTADVDDAK